MSEKETLNGSDSFFRTKCPHSKKRVIIVHDLVLVLEVIAYAVILLFVGLFLEVSIALMVTMVSMFVAIASVASFPVVLLATIMDVI